MCAGGFTASAETLGSWRRRTGMCTVKCEHPKSASYTSTVCQILLWRVIYFTGMFENTFSCVQERMLACYRGVTEKTRKNE